MSYRLKLSQLQLREDLEDLNRLREHIEQLTTTYIKKQAALGYEMSRKKVSFKQLPCWRIILKEGAKLRWGYTRVGSCGYWFSCPDQNCRTPVRASDLRAQKRNTSGTISMIVRTRLSILCYQIIPFVDYATTCPGVSFVRIKIVPTSNT